MTPELTTARLRLEPLRLSHAEEIALLLDDPALHTFIGGTPSTVDELRARYTRQLGGDPGWHNWIVRVGPSPVGTAQATVTGETAEVAWVIATAHQHNGYASESIRTVIKWLRDNGITEVRAHIHPEHTASMCVARALGMHPTSTTVDGEFRWTG